MLTQLLRLAVWLVALPVLAAACPTRAAEPPAEQIEFFEKEVRPLLVKHCYECHGNIEKLKGGLRLTSRAAVLTGGESGPAASPGKPEESLLVEAVRWKGIEMPPGGKLPARDVETLARWIQLDLPWPPEAETETETEPRETKQFTISDQQRAHWAFQPVEAAAPPPVQDATWPAGDIDHFILARLEASGLRPSAPADKRSLLRRISYDLIGLPPTPDELAAFLADSSPEAWSKVVERLLASPQYGERWGRHWLDVVRYADTAGEVGDHPVPDAYRYRNYVLHSFNNDKPYDEFLHEQIAGDLLAAEGPREKYADRVIGTGFLAVSHRFGYNDNKAADMHLTIADTLDTLGRSVLGLSIGCARCHDHKFEPISAEDYYALYGIFSSTRFTFPGAEEVQQPHDLVPLVPPAEAQALLAVEKAKADELAAQAKRLEDEQSQTLAEIASLTRDDGDLEMQALDTTVSSPWSGDPVATISAAAQSPFTNVFAAGTRGIRLPGTAANSGASHAAPLRDADHRGVLHVNVDIRNVSAKPGSQGRYWLALAHRPNWSAAVELVVGSQAIFLYNGAELEPLCDLELGAWYNLQLVADFESQTYSGTLHGAGKPTAFSGKKFKPTWDGTVDLFLTHSPDPAGGEKPERDLDNFAVGTEPFAAADQTAPAAGTGTDPAVLARLRELRSRLDEQKRTATEARNRQAQFLKQLSYQPPYETAYGTVEGMPADTRLQKRGEPDKLGAEVSRRFLTILGADPLPRDGHESGRRQLAEWLTRPTNPLTARVMVNRIWHHHFGKGLVSSPSDFGLRGSRPSHPALLDFLASRFMQDGWSIKNVHRLILSSHAYRMSSADRPDCLTTDPQNELLWRVDPRRLDAECIRDAMLFVSGQLDPSEGGPHPFPPPKSWAFTGHNPFQAVYPSNRRSVYLMTQRFQRHPFLGLFDGANPETSTDLRVITTTPTQALFMMNDPLVQEQAIAFAKRMLGFDGDDRVRLERAYESAYARPPVAAEVQRGLDFLDRYRTRLQQLNVAPADQPVQAWAALLQLLLTSNEFLYID